MNKIIVGLIGSLLVVTVLFAAPEPSLATMSTPNDIFDAYLQIVPKVTTVIGTETTNGVVITRLRFESLEGSRMGTTNRNEIYALVVRPELGVP